MTKRIKLNELEFNLDHIEPMYNEESKFVCSFKISTKLIDFSEQLEEVNGLKKYTAQDMVDYLKQIMKGNMSISEVNGVRYFVRYCCFKFGCNTPDIYCYDCYKSMCNYCFEKDKCKDHHTQSREELAVHMCDGCKRDIQINENRYSYEEDDIDICIDCYKREKDNNLPVFFVHGKEIDMGQYTRFGSIFDWVPVYSCKNEYTGEDFILMCVNPESVYYKKLGLSTTDKQNQRGFYTCPEKDTLEGLLKEFSDTEGIDFYRFCGEKISRIQDMMIERNMNTYYG
jgi:hypothetical protein